MAYEYQTDGAAIYAQSFATIRAEADLARFAPDMVDEEKTAAQQAAQSQPIEPDGQTEKHFGETGGW